MSDRDPLDIRNFYLTSKPQVDQHILNLAEAYIDTAIMIYDSDIRIETDAPFMVNAAFSMELFFKSMLSEQKLVPTERLSEKSVQLDWESSDTEHGHDLAKLFAKIPEKFKNELIEEFRRCHNDFDFLAFLEQHKDDFIKWRYSFEGSPCDYTPQAVRMVLGRLKVYRWRLLHPDAKVVWV